MKQQSVGDGMAKEGNLNASAADRSAPGASSAQRPVIDYEGSGYRTDFWEGRGRAYEDSVERLALQQLIPPVGGRVAEIGAGFGRLANLYLGYEQVILFDYSRTLLQDAVRTWGGDPRFVFVAGDLYALPLATGILDTAVMVRVMHHLVDVEAALTQIRRAMHRQSVAVLEYANKRNLKAVVRWAARRQTWSPWERTPVEFVALNYDFHPAWMAERFEAVGLKVLRQFGVSHFRLPFLKERIGAQTLAGLEKPLFDLGGRYPMAPSVFVQATSPGAAVRRDITTDAASVGRLFRCPRSNTDGLVLIDSGLLQCPVCGLRIAQRQGVWDFKDPLIT